MLCFPNPGIMPSVDRAWRRVAVRSHHARPRMSSPQKTGAADRPGGKLECFGRGGLLMASRNGVFWLAAGAVAIVSIDCGGASTAPVVDAPDASTGGVGSSGVAGADMGRGGASGVGGAIGGGAGSNVGGGASGSSGGSAGSVG